MDGRAGRAAPVEHHGTGLFDGSGKAPVAREGHSDQGAMLGEHGQECIHEPRWILGITPHAHTEAGQ